MQDPDCIIVGGGPAGLFAAERLSRAGLGVHLYDRKPSVARKFLMAGRGGLNLTHSEDPDRFVTRYGDAADWIGPMIRDFTPVDLRQWCDGLGEESFVGSSGRVFPKSFKASPLLRAWLARLKAQGVIIHLQQDWQGWDENGALVFRGPDEALHTASAKTTLLALGGASWPRLGADGGWIAHMRSRGVPVTDLVPVNCGFRINWSDKMRRDHAGQPVKTIALHCAGRTATGDLMITAQGIEGGPVYALSGLIQEAIAKDGFADLAVDLRPALGRDVLAEKLAVSRGGLSFSAYLTRALHLSSTARALLFEAYGYKSLQEMPAALLAERIKAVSLRTDAASGMDRAISVAGGVPRDAVDDGLMIRALPGVFVAGEMLDWQAPTGGYLLQGCFATAARAGKGILAWLERGGA